MVTLRVQLVADSLYLFDWPSLYYWNCRYYYYTTTTQLLQLQLQLWWTDNSKILPLPRLLRLTTHARHVKNNYWSYYHHITTMMLIQWSFSAFVCVGLVTACLGFAKRILLIFQDTSITTTNDTNYSCYTHREQLLVVLPRYYDYHCSYNERFLALVYTRRVIFSTPISTHLWL